MSEGYEFKARYILSVEEQMESYHIVINGTERQIGEALGVLVLQVMDVLADKYSDDDIKTMMTEVFDKVLETFLERKQEVNGG